MFSFTNDTINLEQLKAAAETGVTIRYTNLLLLELIERGPDDAWLVQSEHPRLTHGFDSIEIPDFEPVRNRLKIMAGLDPIIYQRPRSGRIEMCARAGLVYVHVRFLDSIPDPAVRIRMERLGRV